jgi:hypothetical protein
MPVAPPIYKEEEEKDEKANVVKEGSDMSKLWLTY